MNLEEDKKDSIRDSSEINQNTEPKDALEWVVYVLARVGAGYLAKRILRSLGL